MTQDSQERTSPGYSASGPKQAPGRLDDDEFVKRANALRREALREARTLPRPDDLEGFVICASDANGIVSGLRTALIGLKPPEDDQVAFDNFVIALGERTAALRSLGDAAQKRDRRTLRAALEGREEANEAAARLGWQLGLDGCVGGGEQESGTNGEAETRTGATTDGSE